MTNKEIVDIIKSVSCEGKWCDCCVHSDAKYESKCGLYEQADAIIAYFKKFMFEQFIPELKNNISSSFATKGEIFNAIINTANMFL